LEVSRIEVTEMRQAWRIGGISGVVAAAALAVIVVGCASMHGGWDRGTGADSDEATGVSDGTEAATASYRPRSPISLFGEFPDEAAVPFEARATSAGKQITQCAEGRDFEPCPDPSGEMLAFVSTRHAPQPDLYRCQIGSTAVTQVTSDPAADIQPAFSPDGSRIAFASNRTGNFDIWVVGVDGQNAVQLTDETAHDVHPTWSPEGKRIAYCSLNAKTGQWELWMLDLSQPAMRTYLGPGLYPRWSPRDDTIIYQRARARGRRLFGIWTLKLVDGEPRFPTEVAASATEAYILPCFSPDGQHLVFCAVDGLEAERSDGPPRCGSLWMTRVDGSEPVCLTEGEEADFSPMWATDGRIYFSRVRAAQESIWSLLPPVSGGPVEGAARGAGPTMGGGGMGSARAAGVRSR
jgi:TolB protein